MPRDAQSSGWNYTVRMGTANFSGEDGSRSVGNAGTVGIVSRAMISDGEGKEMPRL